MMSMLNRKLGRDLWHLRGQVMAIALVLASAVATVVLSMGTRTSLIHTRDAYYQSYRFADIFADAKRAPESIAGRIRSIPGIARLETRIRLFGILDMPGIAEPVRASILSLPDRHEPSVNALYLLSGRNLDPDNADEVIVHESFADAHKLKPGDLLVVTIYGKQRHLKVVGVGLSPEFVYALGAGDLVPDEKRYAILWMSRRSLEAAGNLRGAFNSVSAKIDWNAQFANIIRRMDQLLAPYGGTGAYPRKEQASHAFLDSELNQLSAITRTIPPVFLGVAVFLVYVVLGRLIQTQREQIGLLKAFGFSGLEISAHFMKLALAIAVIGIILGWGFGIWVGQAMTQLYAQYYRFPVLLYEVSPRVLMISAGFGTAAAVIGAGLALQQVMALNPAVAMSPPAPALYRAGLLERMGLMQGVGTVGFMIVRHVERWPGRSAFTVAGVGAAMGLLLATVQFYDSAHQMMDISFMRSQLQDVSLQFAEPQPERIIFDLKHLPGVQYVELTRAVPATLSNGHRTKRVAIEAVARNAVLTKQLDGEGRHVQVPVQGLMLSRLLAEKLDLQPGALVGVQLRQGHRRLVLVPVAATIDEFIGTRAYMERAALNRMTGDGAVADGANLKIEGQQLAAFNIALKKMPAIIGSANRRTAVRKFNEMIDKNIFTMIFFYVGFASVIIVGVVYNNTRISLAERARELATLRVLGFHGREVAAILVGELALLVVTALPVGLLIGHEMARLIVALFSSDLFRLPFALQPRTYGFAVLVTIVAAFATALAVSARVMHLDLVRVLKARE